jgi:hypothetical protein
MVTRCGLRHIGMLVLVGLLTAVLPTPAAAQTEGTKMPVGHQQVISANPFGLMFKWFNAEYERKFNPAATWGVSGSFFSLGDGGVDYANGSAFCRYYPQGAGLTGFFVGGRGGVYRVAADGASDTFFGLGFEVGYSWLLGAKRHFGVSVGAGATRLFGGSLKGASLTVPSVRLLNLGFAF